MCLHHCKSRFTFLCNKYCTYNHSKGKRSFRLQVRNRIMEFMRLDSISRSFTPVFISHMVCADAWQCAVSFSGARRSTSVNARGLCGLAAVLPDTIHMQALVELDLPILCYKLSGIEMRARCECVYMLPLSMNPPPASSEHCALHAYSLITGYKLQLQHLSLSQQ